MLVNLICRVDCSQFGGQDTRHEHPPGRIDGPQEEDINQDHPCCVSHRQGLTSLHIFAIDYQMNTFSNQYSVAFAHPHRSPPSSQPPQHGPPTRWPIHVGLLDPSPHQALQPASRPERGRSPPSTSTGRRLWSLLNQASTLWSPNLNIAFTTLAN